MGKMLSVVGYQRAVGGGRWAVGGGSESVAEPRHYPIAGFLSLSFCVFFVVVLRQVAGASRRRGASFVFLVTTRPRSVSNLCESPIRPLCLSQTGNQREGATTKTKQSERNEHVKQLSKLILITFLKDNKIDPDDVQLELRYGK